MKRRIGMGFKVTLLFSAIIALIVGAIIVSSAFLTLQGADIQAEKNLTVIAKANANAVSDWLKERVGDVRTFARSETIISSLRNADSADKAAASAFLKEQLEFSPEYEDFFLCDPETGRIVLDGRGVMAEGNDATSSPFWKNIQTGTYFIEKEMHKSPVSGHLVFSIAVPVLDGNGRRIGIAVGVVDWQRYLEKSILPVKVGDTGYLSMNDEKGIILAHPKPELLLTDFTKYDFSRDAMARREGFSKYVFNGIRKVMGFTTLKETNWLLVAATNEIELIGSVVNAVYVSVAIAFGTLIIGIIVTLLFLRTFTVPLKRLSRASEKIASGDLDVEVTVKSRDELGELAGAFASMTHTLKAKAGVLEKIADGDLSVDVELASDADVLGRSMTRMTESLKYKAGVLEKIASGDLGIEVALSSEADTLGNSMTRMTESLKRKAGVLEKIADGDLSVDVELASDADVLGRSMTRMTESLKYKAGVLEKIASGDLSVDIEHASEADGLGRSMTRMIAALKYKAGVLEKIASGDLSVHVNLASDADGLGRSLAQMKDALREVLSQVQSAVSQVTAGAEQISEASQTLSQGSSEQASSIEEISSSVMEISGQLSETAANAKETNRISEAAVKSVHEGLSRMKELIDSMEAINVSTAEIRKIVKTIDDIAFQINLLALNANVEAARAGRYGKGFAVVADEVRNLAVRSAQSVKETTEKVEGIVKIIEGGNRMVGVVAKQLEEIEHGSGQAATLTAEIAAASSEQLAGIEQISSGITQIETVTQSNSANAEETASAAEELSGQAMMLQETVRRFTLEADEETAGRPATGGRETNGRKAAASAGHAGTNGKSGTNGKKTAGGRTLNATVISDDDFEQF